MAEKLNYTKIENENREKVTNFLEKAILDEYGDVRMTADGLAIPVGKSPIDGKMMWVTVKAIGKPIVSRPWGKSTREYYDGYHEEDAFNKEKARKEKDKAERKRLSDEKKERDKRAREKKKAEQE